MFSLHETKSALQRLFHLGNQENYPDEITISMMDANGQSRVLTSRKTEDIIQEGTDALRHNKVDDLYMSMLKDLKINYASRGKASPKYNVVKYQTITVYHPKLIKILEIGIQKTES